MKNPTLQAYEELQQAYNHYNQHLFEGKLPFCLLTFQREKRTYGYFSSKRFIHRDEKITTDEIAINPAYFSVVPLLEILQTMVHEMVHLWQFHFGNPGRRSYHNREWANKMEAIGLMPSSTGALGGKKTGDHMADYAIQGGLFMQATDLLLTDNFKISWLDRFPPYRVQQYLSSTNSVAMSIINNGSLEDDDLNQDQCDNVPFTIEADLAEYIEIQEENRSNRVKYTCPNCLVNVWGKPKIRIICGNNECDAAIFVTNY